MPRKVLGSGDTAVSVIRSPHHGTPCLVEEMKKQSQCRGGKPSTVPAQPEVEGSFKRKELELGMGRGGGSVSGRGNRIRAQIVVLPLPSH